MHAQWAGFQKVLLKGFFIPQVYIPKVYTHTGTSSPQILSLSAHAYNYAFCHRIAIRQPMRTPILRIHPGLPHTPYTMVCAYR